MKLISSNGQLWTALPYSGIYPSGTLPINSQPYVLTCPAPTACPYSLFYRDRNRLDYTLVPTIYQSCLPHLIHHNQSRSLDQHARAPG